MTSQRGFTLIELLITVAIVSIMMAIGLPSFQSIIASSRLTSAANSMVSALRLSRMEALKQHKTVVIYKKTTGWVGGWDVYANLDATMAQDTATEPTIISFDALASTLTVTSTYTNYVSYTPNGRVNTAGHITFCSGTDYRKVVIAATGRIRVETPTSCS